MKVKTIRFLTNVKNSPHLARRARSSSYRWGDAAFCSARHRRLKFVLISSCGREACHLAIRARSLSSCPKDKKPEFIFGISCFRPCGVAVLYMSAWRVFFPAFAVCPGSCAEQDPGAALIFGLRLLPARTTPFSLPRRLSCAQTPIFSGSPVLRARPPRSAPVSPARPPRPRSPP